jgi:predicted dehydrogenase
LSIGIGIVGAGMVGQMCHLANFVINPACQVVAVADLRPELAAAAAAKFGVPRVYRSHLEMLADSDVTSVIVVTRRRATGPIVLDALNCGRHVLSEKPMAYTTAQAKVLLDAAHRQNLIYSVGYMKRHDAGVARAMEQLKRLRADGSLGRIVSARAWCFGGTTGGSSEGFVMTAEPRPDGLELWQDGPDWMPPAMRPAYDTFLNVFSHIINLARYVLGASPMLKESYVSRSGSAALTLDFAGLPCSFELANETTGAWREGLSIQFDRGALTIDLPAPFAEEEARVIVDQGGHIQQVSNGYSWAFRRQAAAFISDIVGHSRPLASGDDSATDIAIAEAIWKRQADKPTLDFA